MSGYVYFTDDQKQRANAVDLEDFLVRQGEKLLRSGREPLTLCRCSTAGASRMP